MTDRRLLLLLAPLVGCLDIKASGGRVDEDFEEVIPDLLRAGGAVLFEVEGGFTFEPVVMGGVNSSGLADTRVDAYPWVTDSEWGSGAAPHAVILQNDGASVTALEDHAHYDRVASHSTGTFHALLYCDAALDLWVHTETAEGWRQTTLAIDDASACDQPVVMGSADVDDAVVLWRGGAATLLRFDTPADGGIDVQQTALTLPVGAPSEVRWVRVTGTDLEVMGEDGAGWAYASAAASWTTAEISGVPLGLDPVRPTEPPTVEVRTSEGRWSWEVGGSGAVVSLDRHPAPDLDADWARGLWPGGALAVERALHPESETIEVAVGVQALVDGDAGVEVVDVPLTPCDDAARCQALGEWEVVGLHRGQQGYQAVYGFLSWWYGGNGDLITGVFAGPIGD
jgi:hypothetical protein